MKTYDVVVSFECTQVIRVEADNADNARVIVEAGEFDDNQIVKTDEKYLDVVHVMEVKPTNGFDG